MRFRKINFTAAVGIAALTGLAVFAPAARAVQPPPGVSDTSASWYLNEWGGNTAAGGTIRMYQAGASNENWGMQAIDRCNGGFTVTHTCPFTVGSGLNDAYFGDEIDQIYYRPHTTTCLGTDANGAAINRSCNDVFTGTGGGQGTVFIIQPHTDGFYRFNLINLYWSNDHGSVSFMCSDGKSNGAFIHLSYPVFTCDPPRISEWNEWN